MTSVARAKGDVTPYGVYGTPEFMRNISAKGRATLVAQYGTTHYGHFLGLKSAQVIKERFGPNGHRLIGKIGGDTVSCKYWGLHCGEIEKDYRRLEAVAESNGNFVTRHPGRSARYRAAKKLALGNGNVNQLPPPPVAFPAGSVGASRRSRSSSNSWDWDNDDVDYDSLYGASANKARTSRRSKY